MNPDAIIELASRAAESKKQSREGSGGNTHGQKTPSSRMVVQDGTEFKDKLLEGNYEKVERIDDLTPRRGSALPEIKARRSSAVTSIHHS